MVLFILCCTNYAQTFLQKGLFLPIFKRKTFLFLRVHNEGTKIFLRACSDPIKIFLRVRVMRAKKSTKHILFLMEKPVSHEGTLAAHKKNNINHSIHFHA